MQLFRILSALISLYAIICFIRVILTWFPGAEYSRFGKFLSSICDPYLNLFRKLSFLRFSAFDFSPAVALCVLFAISTICSGLSTGAGIKFGSFLAMLISMIWSIVQSILFFVIIILVIRLVVYLIKGDSYNYGSIWNSVDRAITPLVYRICGIFTRGRTIPFKSALICGTLILVAVSIIGKILIGFICQIFLSIPF